MNTPGERDYVAHLTEDRLAALEAALASIDKRMASLQRLFASLAERRTRPCRMCSGVGSVPGMWLGSCKTCPSCGGRGVQ
jgi:RecJ-like exonuclease